MCVLVTNEILQTILQQMANVVNTAIVMMLHAVCLSKYLTR